VLENSASGGRSLSPVGAGQPACGQTRLPETRRGRHEWLIPTGLARRVSRVSLPDDPGRAPREQRGDRQARPQAGGRLQHRRLGAERAMLASDSCHEELGTQRKIEGSAKIVELFKGWKTLGRLATRGSSTVAEGAANPGAALEIVAPGSRPPPTGIGVRDLQRVVAILLVALLIPAQRRRGRPSPQDQPVRGPIWNTGRYRPYAGFA
jgi:hypothetical protein